MRAIEPLTGVGQVRWLPGGRGLLAHWMDAFGSRSMSVVPLDGTAPHALFYGDDPAWTDG